jgi:DNA-binding transcriptional ArsR family regulator
MQQFMAITRALGDENRVRILLSLREGELCLCQIVEVLGAAPSTVSKHVDLLRQAGLVDMRKQGRWHYYRLAGRGAPQVVREAIRWSLRSLENQKVIASDAAKLCCVREADPQELTACYSRS